MIRLRRFSSISDSILLLVLVAATAGCARLDSESVTEIAPQRWVEFPLEVEGGEFQVIEVEFAEMPAGGAQVVMSREGLQAIPLYLAPEGSASPWAGASTDFVGRTWSPAWPADATKPVRVANFGPEMVRIKSVSVRQGPTGEALYSEVRDYLPAMPPTWVGMQMQQSGPASERRDGSLPDHFPGAVRLSAEQARREAFESLHGLPPAARLATLPEANLEVRVAAIAPDGVVVGFSRKNESHWKPLGPDWLPPVEEARWLLIRREKAMPRGFTLSGEGLMRLAFFVRDPANTGAPGSIPSALEARLYPLFGTAVPVAQERWFEIDDDGEWLELDLHGGLAPGDYVLELQALWGEPEWLVWNREPEPVPDSEFPAPVEALAAELSEDIVKDSALVEARVLVHGAASSVEVQRDTWFAPRSEPPRIEGEEIEIATELGPGETELFYLRDFRAPYLEGAFAQPLSTGYKNRGWLGRVRAWGRGAVDWTRGLFDRAVPNG